MKIKAKNLFEPDMRNIFLKPGEVCVSALPALVSTVLGSCVSVTLFSPRSGTGAICHGMLPCGSSDTDLRYVDRAIRHIHEQMQALCGGDPLVAKVFGGAELLSQDQAMESTYPVGRQNVDAALRTLAELGFEPAAIDVGGRRGRKLFFYTATGVVYLRQVRRSVS